MLTSKCTCQILWATVFYESNTGWVRYLNQQLASDGRGIGNQAPIPREQVAPAGGGGGGGAARAAGHVGLMDDDDSASLTFVPAASWMLDLRQVPSDVVNQLLKMKNLPFRSKVCVCEIQSWRRVQLTLLPVI